ncbi:DNA mismatch repair endonuclease MutL [bacterium]|nr:DNA mismatch repair endonuclease MutL [bacterium]
MARIRQLSVNLINQIAAGEVIERPASVVKELVENSVDAGAKKISVEITNDCRNIRIADNGCGIHPEDIMLAFTKHAASKLPKDEDLFEINTLGFRGEALASIISISKLTCTTRTAEFDTGTKVTCANSEVKQVETGCAIGTIMDIKELFYNVPARLKFLKNANTEFSYIQDLVQSIAIANPQIAFELKKNDKTILKTSGLGDLKRTIKEIFNGDVVENLKEVLKTDKLAGMKISGFVSTPDFTRSSKKNYYMYINKRSVKCPIFQKSIDMAYRSLIANGKYPFVVLNLEIPPTDVDVNVHPTKKEVRYKNTNMIFNFIFSSIQAGLSNYVERQPVMQTIQDDIPPQTQEKIIEFYQPQERKEVFFERESDSMYVSENSMSKITTELPTHKEEFVTQTRLITPVEKAPENEENIIGQYKNTYIMIEKEDGLEIVDQHIAEERYIYEKLMSEKDVVSQLLFISDVLTVTAEEAEIIKENIEKFERFGYGIEFTKENELIFRKVPQMIAKVPPQEILADILENIEGNIDRLEEKILITTSCKAAVKAGQKLSTWQMQEIIKKWRTTKMPYTCPHGRPISKFFPHKQIAAFFQRQG